MFLLTSDIRECPECAEKMIYGTLDLRRDRGYASVYWKSQHVYAYKTKGMFGREKEVREPITHRLMSNAFKSAYEESAWYCPKCGRIDVTFRAEKMDVSR